MQFGISRVYIEWVNNQVLLYHTGNYIQYAVIKHDEKEYIYMYIYICITESFYSVAEIHTLKSINSQGYGFSIGPVWM